MKILPSIAITALLVCALPAHSGQMLAAAENSPPARKARSGTSFQNAAMPRVAQAWERLFGGTATVSDRVREKRVSLEISASSKDELRQRFVAALRENGIQVINRPDGVLLDAVPAEIPAK